jgi:hypothetical protein
VAAGSSTECDKSVTGPVPLSRIDGDEWSFVVCSMMSGPRARVKTHPAAGRSQPPAAISMCGERTPPPQAQGCGSARRQRWPPRSSVALQSASVARHRSLACSGALASVWCSMRSATRWWEWTYRIDPGNWKTGKAGWMSAHPPFGTSSIMVTASCSCIWTTLRGSGLSTSRFTRWFSCCVTATSPRS